LEYCVLMLLSWEAEMRCSDEGEGGTSRARRWWRWDLLSPSSGISSAGPPIMKRRELWPNFKISPTLHHSTPSITPVAWENTHQLFTECSRNSLMQGENVSI
jgi:hypothetical protein